MQVHKKIEIINSFKSEDDLRISLIIPLFRKMKYQVIDNQGPNEFGNDVILKETNKLGSDEYTSIVLKKGDINNKSGSPSSILKVLSDQVLQAAKAPIDHPEVKKNTYPNFVFVATNGKISVNAKNIFHKLLSEQFETIVNIEYIDQEKIIELIDIHWPEFYSDRRPFLSQYTEILKDELMGVNLTDFGGSKKDISTVLIPQLLNEMKDFGEKANSKVNIKKKPLTPIQLLKSREKIEFISGEAGSGKSTLLKRLAIESLDKGYATPIIINARKFVNESIDNIHTHLLKNDTSLIPIEDIKSELDSTSIVLFIDGLDEISDIEERRSAIKLIEEVIFEKDTNIIKIIATTRPESDGDLISSSSKYKTYQLLPVENRHVSKFFTNWFGDANKRKADTLFNELTRKSVLDRLPKTPLTLTLMAVLYETKGDVPSTLTELYRMFSDLLLGKWDNNKGIDVVRNSQVMSGILSRIAWIIHNEGTNELSQDKMIAASKDYLENSLGDKKTSAEEIIQKIIDRSGLIVPSGSKLKFKHLSFQEYFCAQEIYSKAIFRENFLEWIDSSWWTHVLFFSGGSLKNIDDHVDLIQKHKFKDKFTANLAIGGMLQAAYETSVINKKKLILQSCKVLPEMLKKLKEDIHRITEGKLPSLVPYLIIIESLSDSYSSSFLELPLKETFSEYQGIDDEDIMEKLFLSVSMAKSGDVSGLMELSTSPGINNPIALVLCDLSLNEYEQKYNGGKLTATHKSIKKKMKRNIVALEAIIKPESTKKLTHD